MLANGVDVYRCQGIFVAASAQYNDRQWLFCQIANFVLGALQNLTQCCIRSQIGNYSVFCPSRSCSTSRNPRPCPSPRITTLWQLLRCSTGSPSDDLRWILLPVPFSLQRGGVSVWISLSDWYCCTIKYKPWKSFYKFMYLIQWWVIVFGPGPATRAHAGHAWHARRATDAALALPAQQPQDVLRYRSETCCQS